MAEATRPDGTRGRRLAAAERRAQIVDVGGRLAMTQGLDAVTLRRVAAELEITYGLVNHYFPTIDDLVAEAFTAATSADLADTFSAIAAFPDARSRMRALLERWVSPERDQAGMLWMDAWSRSSSNLPLLRAVNEQMHEGHRRVLALIEEGVAAKQFRSLDPDASAWTLLTLLDGLIVHTTVSVTEALPDVRVAVVGVMERELGLAPGALVGA